MKPHPGKIVISRHFPLICVLLFAMAAFSISAAQQQTELGAGQTADSPAPGSTGDVQQARLTPADQASAPQPAEPVPGAAEPTLKAESPEPPQLPGTTARQLPRNCSPEYAALIEKTTMSLMAANFTFYPVKALDPFVPFITPETSAQSQGEDEQHGGTPLTPLQKMTMSEIERGLKAITWGDMGRRAVIEDSTGRGYIVGVGTPAGDNSGVITQILNDRLIIKQDMWDRKARKRFSQDFTVKLIKKTDEKS